jgi:hypothetical protein
MGSVARSAGLANPLTSEAGAYARALCYRALRALFLFIPSTGSNQLRDDLFGGVRSTHSLRIRLHGAEARPIG